MIRRLNPYRLRLLLRSVFLLLALSVMALALYVLREEKQLSYQNYQHAFHKTAEQINAKLQHPAGQLALLNPPASKNEKPGLKPLLLPFSSLDFADLDKARQAIEMSGCLMQYPDSGSLCSAIGTNPWAGSFIYVAGTFSDYTLQPHQQGAPDITQGHHLRIEIHLPNTSYYWLLPFELTPASLNSLAANPNRPLTGRLSGYHDTGSAHHFTRPDRDFRGWVWQQQCPPENSSPPNSRPCQRQVFFSMRIPIPAWREALLKQNTVQWPPEDLQQTRLHIKVMSPGGHTVLLNSDNAHAIPPFSLNDITSLLMPGETLRIRRLENDTAHALLQLKGAGPALDNYSRLISGLIRRLPVDGYDTPMQAQHIIMTPLGAYELFMTGDIGSVNRSLGAVATRISWFVLAILLALALAWLIIEIGIMHRITLLTRRATQISQSISNTTDIASFDIAELRGKDELGLLATCLSNLLQRVREDIERERIRSEQEKDMWHAVGHEIMSPLQSLMALHGESENQSRRYINRMQQAIRILYGTASPSEAFQASTLAMEPLDIDEFLGHVASNSACVGIHNVVFSRAGPVIVRANPYSLEDVITHVLRNADRFREPGSAIRIFLESVETSVTVSIFNQGAHIADDIIRNIFEYGVSQHQEESAGSHRGQGLFVAKTYMAKMGGTINVRNEENGVSFLLNLPRSHSVLSAA